MRRILPVLAILLGSGWLLHPVLPHEGVHEAVAAALASVTMRGGETLAVVGDGCVPKASRVRDQPRLNVKCPGPTPTAGAGTPTRTPTRTPQVTPAATRTPTATGVLMTATTTATTTGAPLTVTATATATPTSAPPPTATSVPPTPVPPAPVDMHEGVPVCATHDRTRWHALVERNGSGAITCTYAHEHHDNPNTVNDIFGAPSAWYGGQQEISYPWQTHSDLGAENAMKHEGYKYFVYRDMPCAKNPGDTSCMIAWRIQIHSLGGANDAVVRFHSFSAEVLILHNNGTQGIARWTGHLDGGHLALSVDGAPNGGFLCPPLPSNPASFSCGNDVQRRHSGTNVPDPFTDHNSFITGWYTVPVATFFEEWGPIDYVDPSNQLFYGAGANNSRARVSNLIADTTYSRYAPFYAADGTITLSAYRDRANGWAGGGNISTTCTTPSINCWPFTFEALRWGVHTLQTPPGSVSEEMHEHDVQSPVTGRSLIRFPN